MDEKRKLPFLHSVVGWLVHFWPLAVIPSAIVAIMTGSAFGALALAFVLNSLLEVLFYWEDKYRALNNCWRIPEISLHAWELLCGWPGALYAQGAFRHKRRKVSFMIIFWLCAVFNVLLVLWLVFRGSPVAWFSEFWRNLAK